MALIDPTTQSQSFALREAVQSREARANRALEASSLAARLQAEAASSKQAAKLAEQRLAQEMQIAEADRTAQANLERQRIEAEATNQAAQREALREQSEKDRQLQAAIANQAATVQEADIQARMAAILNPEDSEARQGLESVEAQMDSISEEIATLMPALTQQRGKLNQFFGRQAEATRQRLTAMSEQEAEITERMGRSFATLDSNAIRRAAQGGVQTLNFANTVSNEAASIIEGATGSPLTQEQRIALRTVAASSVGVSTDPAALQEAVQTLQGINPMVGTAFRSALAPELLTSLGEQIQVPEAVKALNSIALSFRGKSPVGLTLEALDRAAANEDFQFTGLLDPGASLFQRIDSGEIKDPEAAFTQFQTIREKSELLKGVDDDTAKEFITLAMQEADTDTRIRAAESLEIKLQTQLDALQRRFSREEENRGTEALIEAHQRALDSIRASRQNIENLAR